ncbi:MAG TPA: thioesterase family protein [Longimicrobiales bacterium]|nr:thioesterase family protein [Longimicrobiales bacterium]
MTDLDTQHVRTTTFRARYSETDQMGVVYHANYLVWCEIGRTDYLRDLGMTYAQMERDGLFLAVADASLRFHAAARYDDRIRVDTWIESVRSRAVTFAYRVVRLQDDAGEVKLATATTTLVARDAEGRACKLPDTIRDLLVRAGTDAP